MNEPLRAILRPVVRFCLRRGLSFQAFLDLSRALFVEEARKEIERGGDSANVSRISALTGLNRRQVTEQTVSPDPKPSSATMLSRVTGTWENDRRFSSRDGKPRLLSCEGTGSEFHYLVAAVSKDLNAYTVLKELERAKRVEREDGGVKLLASSFIIRGDSEEGFRLLGDDVHELVCAVEENVLERPRVPNLHLRTEYTRVRAAEAKRVREWLLEEGSALHARARKFLSTLDLDLHPVDVQRTGGRNKPVDSIRVVLGTFGRLEQEEQ